MELSTTVRVTFRKSDMINLLIFNTECALHLLRLQRVYVLDEKKSIFGITYANSDITGVI
jgi:hypothetical protein